MGLNEGSLQVIDRGDDGKLTNIITLFIRYILTIVALRACINDVPKIKIGKNQNQNWTLIGQGSRTSRLRYLIFRKSLPNQRSPQGLSY